MEKKDCTFCAIVSGRIAAAVVHRNEHSVTFLDRRPLFAGHCLVVPREHHVTLLDLPASRVDPLFRTVCLVAKAVEQAMNAEGSFVAINNRVSQSVPHLHIHVVPRRRKDGLRGFFWPRNPYRDEEQVEEVREKIEAVIQSLICG